MTSILRSDEAVTVTAGVPSPAITGSQVAAAGSGYGIYNEVGIYHNLCEPLMAMTADGYTFTVQCVPYGRITGQYGEITVVSKQLGVNTSLDTKKHKRASDPFEHFKTIRIPYATIDKGPYYVETGNLVLFFPRHQSIAFHPGNPNALKEQFDQVLGARYSAMTHSGVVIYAADCYRRISVLYTTMNGHIVSVPVQHPDPETDPRSAIEFKPLGSTVELSLDSHDMILVDYVTDLEQGIPACNSVKTYGHSITELMEQSHELWKIGEQWFSSNRHALTEQLKREAHAEPGGVNHVVIEAAVDAATYQLTEENQRLETTNTMLQAQVKALNAQVKSSVEFVKSAADGSLGGDVFNHALARVQLDAATLELEMRKLDEQRVRSTIEYTLTDQTNKVRRTTNYAAILTSAAKCVPVASLVFKGVMKVTELWKK